MRLPRIKHNVSGLPAPILVTTLTELPHSKHYLIPIRTFSHMIFHQGLKCIAEFIKRDANVAKLTLAHCKYDVRGSLRRWSQIAPLRRS
jgi:hypothetical protein